MANGNKNGGFNIDDFSLDDSDFDDFFGDGKGKKGKGTASRSKASQTGKAGPHTQSKKRSAQDFEPDMDALLLTAQSSMIIEGMKCYSNKNYTAESLQIYIEALKGVEFYIKILDRNPGNYRKLKTLIDSDIDCQQVEKIAFNLFKQTYRDIAETDREKVTAFELLHNLLEEAVHKASITKSMNTVKKYFLMSGGLNTEKIQDIINKGDIGFKTEIKNLHQHVKIALDMLKKGKTEIATGMKGKDINIFITNASELLSYCYRFQGNKKIADYYERIYNIHNKYFIVQE